MSDKKNTPDTLADEVARLKDKAGEKATQAKAGVADALKKGDDELADMAESIESLGQKGAQKLKEILKDDENSR